MYHGAPLHGPRKTLYVLKLSLPESCTTLYSLQGISIKNDYSNSVLVKEVNISMSTPEQILLDAISALAQAEKDLSYLNKAFDKIALAICSLRVAIEKVEPLVDRVIELRQQQKMKQNN